MIEYTPRNDDPPGSGGPPDWFIDGNCENVQCSTSADCEGLGPEEFNINPFGRKLVERAEAGGRRLDDVLFPPLVCIHGLEPLGFIEDGPPGLRRNLRFGNTGGGGCCFPLYI